MPRPWEKQRTRRPKDGLSPRHRKLVDLYFGEANFNKSKAITLAGYESQGNKYTRVFEHPAVAAEVERRHAEARLRNQVTFERVQDELAKVAFSNLYDYVTRERDAEGRFTGNLLFDFEYLDAVSAAAIGEVTIETYVEGRGEDAREVKRVKVKPYSKLQALDQLMRHAGLSKDKAGNALADLAQRLDAGLRRAGKAEEEESDA